MTVLTFPAAPRAGSIPASSPGSEHAPSPGPSALLRTTRARGPHQHPACPELSIHPTTPGLLPTCSALSHKFFISDPAHAVTHQLLPSLSRGRGSPGPGDGKSSGTCPALPLPPGLDRALLGDAPFLQTIEAEHEFQWPLQRDSSFPCVSEGRGKMHPTRSGGSWLLRAAFPTFFSLSQHPPANPT